MNLTVIEQKGKLLVDSREVAGMIGKPHNDLLKSIRGYIEHLTKGNFPLSDFFIESNYKDVTGRTLKCYLLTRKGCDMVANKLTGEKGVLFTAAYVTKFEEMEKQIKPKTQLEILQASINQLVEQERKMNQLEQQVTTVQHRLDNIDRIDVIGDLQQRLNKMIQRFAQQEGLTFAKAWNEFRTAFNTAYHTNLKAKMNNYKTAHGLKTLTMPQYLSLTNQLEDAIRVADKMLNQKKA